MTTHLADHFRNKRLALGLRLGDLALHLGYKGSGRSRVHGCNRLNRFEETGRITETLLGKVAEALDIPNAKIDELREEDLRERARWLNEPIRPHMVVRLMAAVYSPVALPDGIESVEDAERYASEFARERRVQVCLVLSRRISVYFDADGSRGLVTEAVPGDEPNHPYMVVGGKKCLMTFEGFGKGG
jgi:hypothetical protein